MGNKTSDPVLSKLLAADSDLGEQEAKLVAQLNAIQTQRASLQSVLEIFGAEPTAAAEPATVKAVAAAPAPAAVAVVEAPAKKPAKPPSSQPPAATKSKTAPPPRKVSSRPKLPRRGWQKYMRNEYSQTPLPNVVAGILKAQPKKVFEIAEVVDTIVVKAIPHNDRKGARNRISNILAEGARKKDWYRLDSGCYSFSK
ncbi:MAG: hypothetical protein QNJ46_04160 [Leptolyngbyaceae cyanobacterium MO_188.B28]|nr:hypothetical protein [Leptolyngbyaceae cyanobacterium MO_188.B28]